MRTASGGREAPDGIAVVPRCGRTHHDVSRPSAKRSSPSPVPTGGRLSPVTDAPTTPARHPDRSTSALSHLGGLVGRHPKTVVVIWLLAVVAAFAGATGAFGNQSLFDRLPVRRPVGRGREPPGPRPARRRRPVGHVDPPAPGDRCRARRARDRRRGARPPPGDQADRRASPRSAAPAPVPAGLDSPEAKTLLPTSGDDGFAAVVTFDPAPRGRRPATGRRRRSTRSSHDLVAAIPGAHGTTGGLADLIDAITSQVETDLRAGEGIALPISFLVMVLVFGGFVAAGMPIIGAIASIAGRARLAARVLPPHRPRRHRRQRRHRPRAGPVHRLRAAHREPVPRGAAQPRARADPAAEITREEVLASVARTVDSAGRTVVFSGLTVAISLGGLLVFEASILKAIGSAGLSVVLVAMLVALTLVPALCVVGARRLLKRGTEQAPEEGVFSRLATWVFRRPLLVIIAVLAVLGTLAAPALGPAAHLVGQGAAAGQRAAATVLRPRWTADYPQLSGPDVQVVAEAGLQEAQAYAASLPVVDGQRLTRPGRARHRRPQRSCRSTPQGGALDDRRRDAVDGTAADRPAFPTKVIGQASACATSPTRCASARPIAFALVALATLVLLFLMTGSVVIPVKALLMNVVSLGASLGVVVWIFQQGHLQGLLGFDSVGAIESTIPMLVLAFGFGLSMDYEVFLLSRIVELHERGVGNDEAVIVGPAAVGPHHHLGRRSSWSSCSPASSPGSCSSSRRPASAWRWRCCSTPPSCACCSCRPR